MMCVDVSLYSTVEGEGGPQQFELQERMTRCLVQLVSYKNGMVQVLGLNEKWEGKKVSVPWRCFC